MHIHQYLCELTWHPAEVHSLVTTCAIHLWIYRKKRMQSTEHKQEIAVRQKRMNAKQIGEEKGRMSYVNILVSLS